MVPDLRQISPKAACPWRGCFGPAGCGDAAGRHRQHNRSAPLDLPLWARTIKRPAGQERLLAIETPSPSQPAIPIDVRN